MKTRTRKKASEPVQQEEEQARRTQLMELEDDWLKARIRGDAASTERLLDDNYSGSNSEGVTQRKADFVSFVQSPKGLHSHCEHTGRDIRIHGNTAISNGIVTLTSDNRSYRYRYLRVYVAHQGAWRLIASQSTRLRTA